MNRLSITCEASPETNDHRATILVDGDNWLGNGRIGLDPPRLFRQASLLRGGRTLIGRCVCGCEGCDDLEVVVAIEDKVVTWQSKHHSLTFDRGQYEEEIRERSLDYSWENAERRAERLVNAVFADFELDGRWNYDWASARINRGTLTVSFSHEGHQRLLEFGWDPDDPATAQKRAKELRAEWTIHPP